MENKKVIKRAKQFMSFSPLKGYYDLILEKERIKEERRELLEDALEDIYTMLNELKIGDSIKLEYYNIDYYEEKEGIITELSPKENTITVFKEKINIMDIYSIKKLY